MGISIALLAGGFSTGIFAPTLGSTGAASNGTAQAFVGWTCSIIRVFGEMRRAFFHACKRHESGWGVSGAV